MFVLEAAIFLSGIYASQAAACPVGWHRYGETCYLPITTLVTWQDASQLCADQQAQLALPRSQMQQDAIWGMFLELFHGSVPTNIWIACDDIEKEGKWRPCPLRDDDSGYYENWRTGQPDNNPRTADCAAMISGAQGRWGDRKCNEMHLATCQLPAHTENNPLFCLQTDTSGRLASPCLINHVVREVPVTGVLACGKACLSEPRCRSINLRYLGPGKPLCQLNNITLHAAQERDFVEKKHNCFSFPL